MEDVNFLVVITYDISDNKKRNKFSKLLLSYGVRAQKSVFECRLNKKKIKNLINDIEKIIDIEDYVRMYKIRSDSEIHIWGNIPLYEEEDFIFI